MADNMPEPLKLATAMVGHPWHPTKDVALLLGVKYSIPRLLEFLGKLDNNNANHPDTQVCNLKRLRGTFSVTHHLLSKLFIPEPGQAPLSLSDEENQTYSEVGNRYFWEFIRLLLLVENHTIVGVLPVGDETLVGLYVENLESSKLMETLRKGVDQDFNRVVVQRLKEVMDEQTRENMLQVLKGIDGVNADLRA